MARVRRGRHRPRRHRARAFPARPGGRRRPRARREPAVSARPPATSTPSRPTSSRRFRATSTSSGASARSTAGTRWRRWCGATRCRASTAGTSPRFASSAVLYDIGLNHFWRTRTEKHGGDLVFFQGHAIPGIYARSFMEGRLSEETLDNFRSETGGEGLSSYPHPWLMPDYWQFPTVSMGLGPLMAIYQARFMKYMHNRGLIDTADRKVWAFLGDGEMDEPESLGAIGLAGARGARQPDLRHQLQPAAARRAGARQRQDHPGARGRLPRRRLERHQADLGLGLGQAARAGQTRQAAPADGRDRRRRLPDLQVAQRRLHPRAFLRQVSGDREAGRGLDRRRDLGAAPRRPRPAQGLRRLRPRGEDQGPADGASSPRPSRATAWARPARARTSPTSRRSWPRTSCRRSATASTSRCPTGRSPRRPTSSSATSRRTTSCKRRDALGGPFPVRAARQRQPLEIPDLSLFDALLKDTGDREISTTMAFVRVLNALCRDKKIGKYVVPIVPDESRTFGMEGMFRQLGIYSPMGQLYTPQDADQLMLLQGEQGRPGAAGGHQRGRRDGRLDRRGDVLLGARRADDPVLHLLLDVRLPAGRRPRLGRRRQPGARLPARRHRRADDAERRGAAARGRPQPHPRRRPSRTASPTTRPSATRSR